MADWRPPRLAIRVSWDAARAEQVARKVFDRPARRPLRAWAWGAGAGALACAAIVVALSWPARDVARPVVAGHEVRFHDGSVVFLQATSSDLRVDVADDRAIVAALVGGRAHFVPSGPARTFRLSRRRRRRGHRHGVLRRTVGQLQPRRRHARARAGVVARRRPRARRGRIGCLPAGAAADEHRRGSATERRSARDRAGCIPRCAAGRGRRCAVRTACPGGAVFACARTTCRGSGCARGAARATSAPASARDRSGGGSAAGGRCRACDRTPQDAAAALEALLRDHAADGRAPLAAFMLGGFDRRSGTTGRCRADVCARPRAGAGRPAD